MSSQELTRRIEALRAEVKELERERLAALEREAQPWTGTLPSPRFVTTNPGPGDPFITYSIWR